MNSWIEYKSNSKDYFIFTQNFEYSHTPTEITITWRQQQETFELKWRFQECRTENWQKGSAVSENIFASCIHVFWAGWLTKQWKLGHYVGRSTKAQATCTLANASKFTSELPRLARIGSSHLQGTQDSVYSLGSLVDASADAISYFVIDSASKCFNIYKRNCLFLQLLDQSKKEKKKHFLAWHKYLIVPCHGRQRKAVWAWDIREELITGSCCALTRTSCATPSERVWMCRRELARISKRTCSLALKLVPFKKWNVQNLLIYSTSLKEWTHWIQRSYSEKF